ncbi:acyltransferase [Streptomyces sp. NPDC050315]|uniref:acyltransferase family protein n=1 Tax=Streptomyces sp. NPDC050315 TaxID=3155039 RepID=UPI00341A3E83
MDTSKAYAPALDGMRAVAALLVIALHVGIYTGQVASSWLGIGHGGPLGWLLSRFTVGVPVFFVLSGLLLYRPYANAGRDGTPRPHAGRYLWHRALRILPAYWVVALVALVAFTPLVLGEPWPTVRTLALLHIYEPNVIPVGVTQTWSLATEVAFYAVLPLLALALHPLLRRPAAVFAALGLFELVSLVSIVATHVPAAGPYPAAVFWLPEYLGYFAAGMGLAVIAARGTGLGAVARHPWASWGVAVLAYAVVSTPLTGSTAAYPTVAEALLEHVLYLLIALALVAPLVLRTDRGPAPLLSRPAPAWLGRISYGLFLWHMVWSKAGCGSPASGPAPRASRCSSPSPSRSRSSWPPSPTS